MKSLLVGVDVNVLIYALGSLNNENSTQAVAFLKGGEEGKYDISASTLVIAELLSPAGLSPKDALKLYNDLQKLKLELKPINEEILLKAGELRRLYKPTLADSIHLASAIIAKATQFITNDRDLIKLAIKDISIVGLKDINRLTL